MNFYQKMILATTGCEAAEVDAIEDLMRDAHNGILGNLSRAQLEQAAKVSFQEMKEAKR